MVETSKIECCRIKEKENPQESWSSSSHKYILYICIFIHRFQYLLFRASGVSSWVYPSCTYLCCINNSLSLSPVYLNLQVFTPVLFCCATCLSVWLLLLPSLPPVSGFLREAWVLKYFWNGSMGEGVLFHILVLSFHPQNSSHIFFFPAVSLVLRYFWIFLYG